MSRQTRATTVVSQPPRFATASVSERLSRSHASWTASSASLDEPSIRYATARRWARLRSNSSVWGSVGVTSHRRVRIRHLSDERRAVDVTAPKGDPVEPAIEVNDLRKTYPGGIEPV